MTLKFGPARTDSVIIQGRCNCFCMLFLESSTEAICNGSFPIEDLMWLLFFWVFPDQTPTPTRFLKNCEEVGLFNELAGSFDQEFGKTQEDDHRTKHPVSKQLDSEV